MTIQLGDVSGHLSVLSSCGFSSAGSQPQDFPGGNLKLAQYTEGKERHKTEAGHSRRSGGGFKKQGNLLPRLVLDATRQADLGSLRDNLKCLYTGLVGISHLYPSESLNTSLS